MENSRPVLIHATAVALPDEGEWAGLLLRGAPGSGKSDLALRLIDQGARLIADDQTELRMTDKKLMLRAPVRISGHLEVRGFGIITLPVVEQAPLVLVANLVGAEAIDRLPLHQHTVLAGVRVAVMDIAPFQESATAKLRLAVREAMVGSIETFDRVAQS